MQSIAKRAAILFISLAAVWMVDGATNASRAADPVYMWSVGGQTPNRSLSEAFAGFEHWCRSTAGQWPTCAGSNGTTGCGNGGELVERTFFVDKVYYISTGNPFPNDRSVEVEYHWEANTPHPNPSCNRQDHLLHQFSIVATEVGDEPLPNNPDKPLSCPTGRAKKGNPCDAGTGNKYQLETDFTAGVGIDRHYNSLNRKNSGMGVGWSSRMHAKVEVLTPTSVRVRDSNGRGFAFVKAGGVWYGEQDALEKLTQDSSGYAFTYADGRVKRFNTTGNIVSEQTSTGRTTTYNYGTNGRLTSIVDPSGNTVTLSYNTAGLVSSITDGGGAVTQYSYTQTPVAQSYKEEVLGDAPRGYWRLRDSSGTTAAVEPGIGDNASVVGAGTYGGAYTLNQSGPSTSSVSAGFDATGDGEVALNDTANNSQAITLEMWVNPSSVQPEYGFLFSKSSFYATSYANFPISLVYYPSYGFALLLSRGNDYSTDLMLSSGAVTPGQWYHVVAVYRANGQCELWLNGVLIASQTINFSISASEYPWRIANAFEVGGGSDLAAFSGKISDAALYWAPLSAERIQAHYNAINTARDVLSRVDYADGSAKIYHYENTTYPTMLTGISHVEPNGTTTRYSTYGYNTAGKATSTEHYGGAGRYDIAYDSATQSTVTDSAGRQTVLTFASHLGIKNVIADVDQSTGDSVAQTFDSQNRVTCKKDEAGNVTTYTYNGYQKLSMTEGQTGTCSSPATTSATRTTTYAYPSPSDLRLGSTRTTSVAGGYKTTSTTYAYGVGVEAYLPLQITRNGFTPGGSAISRTTTYTYNSDGQVLTVNGPRTDVTDVTTYTYYSCSSPIALPCGLLHTVTNALGHVTTYNTYNAVGQPLTITDANGVVTTLTYDSRRRLSTRTVGTETTTFDYYAAGHVKKVTMPDGSFIAYGYDGAERLTSITDNEGNSVVYTLDSRGNRTEEKSYDPSSALTAKRTRAFNILNQLASETGAAGTSAVTTTFDSDDVGNQTGVNAPLARDTENVYDELNRLKKVTDPANGDTLFGYNQLDQLLSVTDPRGKVTSYSYTDLGDLLEQVSPDTGTTTNTYDSAGNLATTTDSRGSTTTHSYDKLNRVTQSVTTDQTIQYHYDTGTNGKGRLVDVADNSGQTVWTYDPQGRPTSRQQIMSGFSALTNYGYDSYGRPSSITFPSGHVIQYGYTNGKITSITLNGSTTVLSNVLYQPFGPIKGWTWGNSTTTSRTFDQDTKITAISSAGSKSYSFDDAFRITGVTDASNSALNQTLGYDALDRLTSASRTGLSQTWTYDANGNRLTEGGTSASTFTNSSTSNRLSSVSGAITKSYSYDNAGNTQSDGTSTFTYDQRGRMLTATKSSVTTTYSYNALGQRVKKSNSGSTRYFVYDEAGHLLGEYTGSGVPIQEIVWLGDIPVASIRANESGSGVGVFYIHTDHLNTPRKITRPTDSAIVWRWDSDPFGNGAPNEDADGNSLYVAFNLRFPGQYFDSETGLHYNYYRDYDPATGRYVESDPIGLDGGTNTYAYVSGNPVLATDPSGLLEYFTFTLNDKPVTTLQCQCGEQYQAFSGVGDAVNDPNQVANTDIGPIPKGSYYIVARKSGGRLGALRDWAREIATGNDASKWFALIAKDGNSDDCTVVNGTVRCNFRLHPGTISKGCITLKSESEFFKLRERLLKTTTGLIPGTKTVYYGEVTVQ